MKWKNKYIHECVNPSITVFTKGEFLFLIPPVFLTISVLYAVLRCFSYTYVYRVIVAIKNKQDYRSIVLFKADKLKSKLVKNLRLFHTFLHFMYVILASWALGFFSCSEIGNSGVFVMRKAPTFVCYQEDHLYHLPYYTVALFVYVIGIPCYYSTLYALMYQNRVKSPFMLSIKDLVSQLLLKNKSVYKPDRQFIISAQLFLKLAILLALNFILDSVPSQAVVIFMAIFGYFSFLLHYKPYNERYHLQIDYLCQFCCIVTVSMGMLFYVNDIEDKSFSDRYTLITIGTTAIFISIASIFMLKDCLKAYKVLKEMATALTAKSSSNVPIHEEENEK